MSYKSTLCALLLLPINLLGQDYHYKIDNRLTVNRGPQFTQDSVRKYVDNYYQINFNFHHQIIRDSYNDCVKRIDSTGLLDSIIISNSVGTPMTGFRLYIGSKVPFKVSKAVIDFYYNELHIEEIELIMILDIIPPSINWNSTVRKIVVVGGSCPYNSNYRYISEQDTIEKLLQCQTQEDFIQFFQDHDEKKEQFRVEFNKKNEWFKNSLRFSGCEEIEDVRVRYECAKENLDRWLRENIIERLNITPNSFYLVSISLRIDKEGKIAQMHFPSYLKEFEVEQLRNVLNTMPKWIAPRINGEPIECSKTLHIDFKIKP